MESQPQQKQINFLALIHTGFWIQLSKMKIEEWKLDQTEKTVYAKYKNSSFKEKKSKLIFDSYSFDQESSLSETGPLEIQIKAKLINFNTIEEFNNFDLETYIQQNLEKFNTNITNFATTENNNNNIDLSHPILLTFSDLKHYQFYYKLICPGFILNNVNIL